MPGKEIYLTLRMLDELHEPYYIDLPSPQIYEQFGEVKAHVMKSFVPSEIFDSSRPGVAPKEWGSLVILSILKQEIYNELKKAYPYTIDQYAFLSKFTTLMREKAQEIEERVS